MRWVLLVLAVACGARPAATTGMELRHQRAQPHLVAGASGWCTSPSEAEYQDCISAAFRRCAKHRIMCVVLQEPEFRPADGLGREARYQGYVHGFRRRDEDAYRQAVGK